MVVVVVVVVVETTLVPPPLSINPWHIVVGLGE